MIGNLKGCYIKWVKTYESEKDDDCMNKRLCKRLLKRMDENKDWFEYHINIKW